MKYIGQELDIFKKATNWKRYFLSYVHRYIKGDVLEVGAGIGGTTTALYTQGVKRWVCLEPDGDLLKQLSERISVLGATDSFQVVKGTIVDVPDDQTFDCILYIDVLEHIEDDERELLIASRKLKPGGFLIVLSPASPMLYSKFDQALGHFRRYTRQTISKTKPLDCTLVSVRQLDSLGALALFAFKLFANSGDAKGGQVYFWDKFLVPFSVLLDRLTFYRFGRSIIMILRKDINES